MEVPVPFQTVISANGHSALDDNLDDFLPTNKDDDGTAKDTDGLVVDEKKDPDDDDDEASSAYMTYDPDNAAARSSPSDPHAAHRATFRAMGGAAVAGGVAGALLLGPLVGIVAAGGFAATAAHQSSKAGQFARSTGEAVAGVGDRLQKFDHEHHVVDRVTEQFHKTATFLSEKLEPCYNPQNV